PGEHPGPGGPARPPRAPDRDRGHRHHRVAFARRDNLLRVGRAAKPDIGEALPWASSSALPLRATIQRGEAAPADDAGCAGSRTLRVRPRLGAEIVLRIARHRVPVRDPLRDVPVEVVDLRYPIRDHAIVERFSIVLGQNHAPRTMKPTSVTPPSIEAANEQR